MSYKFSDRRTERGRTAEDMINFKLCLCVVTLATHSRARPVYLLLLFFNENNHGPHSHSYSKVTTRSMFGFLERESCVKFVDRAVGT